MNVVRYYLSFCVLIAHTAYLTGLELPWIQRGTVDVGCFFAISGFLMFPSFQKNPTWKHYVKRRALRILPPYVFIIVIAALLLVFVSDKSTIDYFSNSGFYKYLLANLSFMNFLHPNLPGVFESNEFVTSAVNGSLWTMKGEWVCYLSVPVVYSVVCKLGKNKGRILLIIIVLTSVVLRCLLLDLANEGRNVLYEIIARQFGTVFVFFYVGALLNICWVEFLKYKWYVLVIDLVIIMICDNIPFYYTLLQPFVAGSLVLWFSLIGHWGTMLSKHDSVSYDIYLFHFPIIQFVIFLGLPKILSPIGVLLVILSITVPFAFMSWNLIGKRFSRLGNESKLNCKRAISLKKLKS